VLDSTHEVCHGRGHDPGAAVELPELLAVRGAIRRQHPVRATLEDEIAARRENAAAFHNRIACVPHAPLLGWAPRE